MNDYVTAEKSDNEDDLPQVEKPSLSELVSSQLTEMLIVSVNTRRMQAMVADMMLQLVRVPNCSFVFAPRIINQAATTLEDK